MFNFNKNKKASADLYSSLYKGTRTWRVIALVLLLMNVFLGVSYVELAKREKIVPWVVQVDKHGFEVAVGPAERGSAVDHRVVISRIGRFIECLRTVVSDREAQKSLVEWVYATIPQNSLAQNYTNKFYWDNDPVKIATSGLTVAVEVKSILPISANTYRAEWIEKTMKNGNFAFEQHWTGVFTIAVSPTREITHVIKNPLGVYITEYTATQNYN